jgi:hypothetical protein
MKQKTIWLGWCVVVSGLLGACGKADGSGAITRQDLPARIAQIQCDGLVECCKRQGQVLDGNACKEQLAADWREEVDKDYGPNVGYDAQAAGDCLAYAAGHAVCGDLEDIEHEACERIFHGTLAEGAICTESDECLDSANGYAVCDEGVCRQLRPIAHARLGEACSVNCDDEGGCVDVSAPAGNASAACYRADGLRCGESDVLGAGNCEPLAELGERCSVSSDCVAAAICGVVDGICSAPKANGEACISSGECQSRYCEGVCANQRTSVLSCSLD